MCIHTLGHTTIYNLKKKKKLRLSLNLRKCFILPMSTNFCQLLNEQTNEQLKLCLSQHHAARIIWQYFLLWWTFEHIIAKKTLLRIFPKRVVQKIAYASAMLIYDPHKIFLYCFLCFFCCWFFLYIWSLWARNSILDCPDFWTTRINYSAGPRSKTICQLKSHYLLEQAHDLEVCMKKEKDLRQQKARHT